MFFRLFNLLRCRFARQIAFVKARLSPAGYMGLHLTLGALVIIGAGWLFGGIAEDVVNGDPLTIVDARVAVWLHAHAAPALTPLMLLITNLHDARGISILAVTLAVLLIRRRDWFWLQALAVVLPGGMLLNVLTKFVFQRARPSFDDPILALGSYSFPSGHVTAATLFYGLLAAYLMTWVAAWRWRVVIAMSAAFIVALVAFTRVYLGVHYLSDVLAAFAQAAAWLAFGLTALDTMRGRRAQRLNRDLQRGGANYCGLKQTPEQSRHPLFKSKR